MGLLQLVEEYRQAAETLVRKEIDAACCRTDRDFAAARKAREDLEAAQERVEDEIKRMELAVDKVCTSSNR
jgi:hypothetical protein